MALLTPQDTNNDKEMEFDFHFPTSKKALLIFTRNPELGKVKTRLAKSVGDESALNIYKFLIQHTVEITKNLNVDKYVFYSEEIHNNDSWDSEIFRKRLQHGNNLGERMHNAFAEIFEMGYQMAIIIGCDMYEWNTKDLGMAFDTLKNHQFVIGPALDGGYYLLGLKELNSKLFSEKKWGTNSVLTDTLNNIKEANYVLLKERNDIDIYEDIKDNTVFHKFLSSNMHKKEI